jgi:hypothetical protein
MEDVTEITAGALSVQRSAVSKAAGKEGKGHKEVRLERS